MALYQDRLISEVQKLCKKGQSVENFVNNWIRSGETFKSLFQFLISKGIETNKDSVWKTFRPMLTIPYFYKDLFFYKWDSVAKTKGFINAKQMITSWKKQKYTQVQIAEELGLFPGNLNVVIKAILDNGENFKTIRDLKHPKARDKDGFSKIDVIHIWEKRLKKMGYLSLRHAISRMKNDGFNYSDIARKLEVSPRNFRLRRKRIKELETM